MESSLSSRIETIASVAGGAVVEAVRDSSHSLPLHEDLQTLEARDNVDGNIITFIIVFRSMQTLSGTQRPKDPSATQNHESSHRAIGSYDRHSDRRTRRTVAVIKTILN